MNRAFRDSLGLPPDAFPPGTPVEEAVRASALRGVYGPGDPEAQVEAVMAADRSRPGRLRRRTFEGRSLDLYNTPLPDGGYVVSAVETTALVAARADAEARAGADRGGAGDAADRPGGIRSATAGCCWPIRASPPCWRCRRIGWSPGSAFDAMLALMETREEFASPDGRRSSPPCARPGPGAHGPAAVSAPTGARSTSCSIRCPTAAGPSASSTSRRRPEPRMRRGAGPACWTWCC